MKEAIEALKVGEAWQSPERIVVERRSEFAYVIWDMVIDRCVIVPDSRRAAVMVQLIQEGDYWNEA